MSDWAIIAKEQNLAARLESETHAHAPEEHAEWFHSLDSGTTEFEYLNLLNALVRAAKPQRILETGCFKGMGTLALASAVAANGFGRVFSIDLKPPPELTTNLKRYGLDQWVEIVASESVTFCGTYAGDPFDFGFFDSDINVRHREHDLLRRRRKLAPGALCAFHDASPLRYGMGIPWSVEYIRYTEALTGITFPLSRGLRITQEPLAA